MAPTIAVDADPTQVDATTAPPIPHTTATPLAALGQPVRLPIARALRDTLTDQLAAGVEDARHARGPVTVPEDTHDLIRAVQAARNHAAALIVVLKDFIDQCDGVHAEELATAVGTDRHGVPLANMAVPFDGEKIRLTRKFDGEFTTDVDQLLVAVRSLVTLYWTQDGKSPADDPEQFAREVSLVMLNDVMGKSKPKVTGVEALAVTLGHHEQDDAAAIARGAHRRTSSVYKGIGIEQVTPAQEKAAPVLPRRR